MMLQVLLLAAIWSLFFNDVSSLHALRSLYEIVSDGLAFVKGFEAFTLDGGEMNEYVISVFAGDKTIPFFCVEPLNSSLVHHVPPYNCNNKKHRLADVFSIIGETHEKVKVYGTKASVIAGLKVF